MKTTLAITLGFLLAAGMLGCSRKTETDKIITPSSKATATQAAARDQCVSNLKQIGLAIRIWSGDHGDKYPWNVSAKQGGTLESCAIGGDGFDSNAALHFQVMSNELSNPIILVCPGDDSKKPSINFHDLSSANITYQLRTGPKVDETNPAEVVAVCPIDGNTLYADGHVMGGAK